MSVFSDWGARRHGGLAEFYEFTFAGMEKAGLRSIRARLAGDLSGRILEIGCGTGLNFAHYPATAHVTAIEPLPEFREFASRRAATCAATIDVIDGDAENLPFADGSFDAVLSTLVFCSIPNATRALAEVRRVVRPGGTVRFFEHVRSPNRGIGFLQDIVNPLWRYLLDGCNVNRDTVPLIRGAGFAIDRVDEHRIEAPGTPPLPMREVHARVA